MSDPVVGRMIAPKDVHVLIPGSCEYVTLCSQTDFVDMIKVKDLEIEKWSWWVQSNHMSPYKQRNFPGFKPVFPAFFFQSERDVMTEERSDRCKVGFEDRGRGSWTKECRQPLESGKGKETVSSLEPPERKRSCQPLYFSPETCHPSDLFVILSHEVCSNFLVKIAIEN